MLQRRDVPFVAVIGLLPFVLAACSDATSSTDPRTQTPLVRVATVETAVQTERSFTGIVAARVQSDLGFRVPGKVLERLVDTGQTVKRGQPLMRIDPTDLRLATRAHEEAVAAARARARQTAEDEVRYRRLVSADFGFRIGLRPSEGCRRVGKSGAQCGRGPGRRCPQRDELRRPARRCRRRGGRDAGGAGAGRRLPARSSSVWRMPGDARRSSSFPKPCARRSDPPAGRPCMEAG